MLKSSIYIGENIYISRDDIIAIFDSKTILKSKDGKDFINKNKNKGFSHLTKGQLKSFILTSFKGQVKIYESNISSDSIKKKFKTKGLKNIDE